DTETLRQDVDGVLLRLRENVEPREAKIDVRVAAILREGLQAELQALADVPGVPHGETEVREHRGMDRSLVALQPLAVLQERFARVGVLLEPERVASVAKQLLLRQTPDVERHRRISSFRPREPTFRNGETPTRILPNGKKR